jgi:type IV pilus assembly protein PilV
MINNKTKRESGLTLIEVLIALVILSIGLLALASTKLMGLRGNNSAYLRSHAAIIANDLAERMHANPDGNYAIAIPASCNITRQCSGANVNSCDADQMALFDVESIVCGIEDMWGDSETHHDRALLSLTSIVCNDAVPGDGDDCSPGSPHVIQMTWSEPDPNRRTQLVENQAHDEMYTPIPLEIVVVP